MFSFNMLFLLVCFFFFFGGGAGGCLFSSVFIHVLLSSLCLFAVSFILVLLFFVIPRHPCLLDGSGDFCCHTNQPLPKGSFCWL